MTVTLLQHAARGPIVRAVGKQFGAQPPVAQQAAAHAHEHAHEQGHPMKLSGAAAAMHYYRIWIYTCNAVLLVSVLGFTCVAARLVVGDPKRYLVPGLSLSQPSFLYAYLALATQSGVIQVVGCLGALRLNERLLNVYWLLLLVLLCGDALVGVVWIFRFDKICAELRPSLKARLSAEYGVERDFTALWDAVQRDLQCCGVDGARDFPPANRSDEPLDLGGVPASCCRAGGPARVPLAFSLLAPHNAGAVSAADNRSLSRVLDARDVAAPEQIRQGEPCPGQLHPTGCEPRLLLWLRHRADVLFVLGFCVIAFLKLCFLGILRYEIREMIQKIKILHNEINPPVLLLTNQAATPATSPTAPPMAAVAALNAHVPRRENGEVAGAGARRMTSSHLHPPPMQGGESAQTTPLHAALGRHLLLNDGTDSDTNSNCALILGDDRVKRAARTNELHELHELDRLLSRHRSEI